MQQFPGGVFHPDRLDMNRPTIFRWHGRTRRAGGVIIQGVPAIDGAAVEGNRMGGEIGLCRAGMF